MNGNILRLDNNLPRRFLCDVMVEGKYAPSAFELRGLMDKIDLGKIFESARFEGNEGHRVRISFDSLRQSHLFVLSLYVIGIEMGHTRLGPSDDFFKEVPLDDCRIDGAFLCMNEELKGGRSIACVYLRNIEMLDEQHRRVYSDWVKSAVTQNMPQLSEEMEGFNFCT